MTLLLPLLGFLFVSLLVAGAAMFLSPSGSVVIQRRLGEIRGMPVDTPAYSETAIKTFKQLAKYAPQSPSEMGKLQQRLVAAGFRNKEARTIFIGIRLAFALLTFLVASSPIIGRPNVFLAIGVAALGYLLPSMVLGRLAKKRQQAAGAPATGA